ncbi:MAG: DUF3352 domain-containing protein [Pseudanabaenaceae cyanobacterium SKYGB_i_bin29]|nr:DUF3352 domain-containing protein [Pseudanabaenaceae cyanobacterium SKYG29]MDW8421171.1 DUF3352 domain-containing protein [Pseudanabaenaceae cyanobacterium SKYGB_i_bin29]
MQKQRVIAVLGVIAALALLIGFSLWGRVLALRPAPVLVGQKSQPLATKFISKQAPLVASLLVNPDRLGLAARLFTAPSHRRQLRQEWQAWHSLIQQNWLVDYDRYISAWAGDELTLAVTTADLDRDGSNGLQPGYLIAVAIAQPQRARRDLERFWQNLAAQGANLLFEQHEGIPIITTDTTPSVAGATLGNYAIFANDVRVIRNAINDLQVSDLSLANSSRYRTILANLKEKRIGFAFINLTELGDWGTTAGFLGTPVQVLPAASVGVGLRVKNGQVEGEVLLVGDRPWTESASSPTAANGLVKLLPPHTTVLAGHDLQTTWQNLRASLTPYPGLQQLVQKLVDDLGQAIGFNLETDIFTWVRGDYALAIGADSNWLFLAAKTPDVNTSAALENLDKDAQQRLTVGKINLKNHELTVWTDLQASDPTIVKGRVHAVHSSTDRVVGFASSVPVLIAALDGSTTPAPLPKQDFAHFDRAVALPAFTDLLQETMPTLPNLVSPLLHHLQSVTIARLPSSTNTVLRGQIFLQLQ